MPASVTAPPPDSRDAPEAEEPSVSAGGTPSGQFDPLAETVRPTAADVAVTRRLSRPGARRAEPKPIDPPGYRLRHLIGRGGFGAVWLATESATGKQVAVKTFRHVRALDWPLLTREVEKLAALDASRHVVQLLGVGWEADPPYYVMEYLPDGSLADLLAKPSPDGAPLPPQRAAELAEGIAAGLVHAHGSGILHCDLKPGNVLLDRDGVPRLCDFGQARGVDAAGAASGGSLAGDSASEARTGGRPLGTLFYMPPEQAAPDAAPDARWDVYALGAVLYEMLTGAPPHRSEALSERLKQSAPGARLDAYREAIAGAPKPTAHHEVKGVDGALEKIVDRCLAPDPADRFPNAQAVRTALRQRTDDAARRSRARWALLGPAAVAATLIAVGAVMADHTIEAGNEQVVDRAMDTNALSAAVVARSLEREVRRKREGLEAIAADDRLVDRIVAAAAENWADGPATEALAEFLAEITPPTAEGADAATLDGQGTAVDMSWFLQDATGVTRWRKPFDDEVVDHNFAYRTYFHGGTEDLDADDTEPGDVPPVDHTQVSLPYDSTSTHEWKLAISTPVRDEKGTILAVLARTVLLDALLAEYDSTKRGITGEANADRPPQSPATAEPRPPEPRSNEERPTPEFAPRYSRVIALYERRTGDLLDHPWLADRPDAAKAELNAVRLPKEERDALAVRLANGGGSFRTPLHTDPTANAQEGQAFEGAWIAAFAPVGGTDWVVVVQEPRADALRALEATQTALLQTGVVVVGGILAALAGLFYWITRDRAAA